MARARLREDQIRDPDNLSEGEHDVLVHENLVTSGTLNFQDGTISGTGDVYANAFYGDGSTLSGVGGGNPESLYYDGEKRVETAATGQTNFYDSGGTDYGSLIHNGGQWAMKNWLDSGTITFYGLNSVSAQQLMGTLNPDGGYTWNHLGVTSIASHADGILIYDGGVQEMFIGDVSGNSEIYSYIHGQSMSMRGENLSGGQRFFFVGDPDDNVRIFHPASNAVVLETDSGGINVYDSDASDYLELQHNGSHVILNNATDGGGLYFRTNGENQIVCNDDAGPALYYNNNIQLQTLGTGISIYNAGTSNYAQLVWSADNFYVVNPITSGQILLRGKQADTTVFNMLTVDPDGATDLTYNGTKTLYTNANGLYFSDGTNIARLMTASGHVYLENQYHGGNLTLRGEDSGGSEALFLVATNEGKVALYYDDTLTFETTTGGIIIQGGGQDDWYEYWTAGVPETWIRSSGETYTIAIDNASNLKKTVATFDADGAAELYYAGTKEAETIDGALKATNGFVIASTTTVSGILDEDDLVSDSDTDLATQQSIKAYVDSEIATVSGGGGGIENIDGGAAATTYLTAQAVDGGDVNGD